MMRQQRQQAESSAFNRRPSTVAQAQNLQQANLKVELQQTLLQLAKAQQQQAQQASQQASLACEELPN